MSGRLRELAAATKGSSPMLLVHDMRATVRWYESIGFTLQDQHETEGELVFARLTFGAGELTLSPGGHDRGSRDVRLWFLTTRVRDLCSEFKQRPEIRFEEELYQPFYGGDQFSIRDFNGVPLIFWQPKWLTG